MQSEGFYANEKSTDNSWYRTSDLLICSTAFLSSEGVKPIELHQQMKVQYGDTCLSLQQVYEWTRKFMNSISSVTESTRPGQAH